MDIQAISAIILYIAATFALAANVFNIFSEFSKIKWFILFFGLIALVLHAEILYQSIFMHPGLNFGFFIAISVIAWLVALIVLILSFNQPIQQLLLVFNPIAAITIFLEQFIEAERLLTQEPSMGLRIHMILSICAYSLLMIGTLQALLLALQEKLIKTKQVYKVIDVLPPLEVMEKLLIQIIVVGFFLLSLSLITGVVFVYDIYEQHLTHKTVLSALAWFIYAILLWGRWFLGWRGRRIINWVIGGFISLLLAYTGSKFILEFILHRV